jgi:hypothetical protein
MILGREMLIGCCCSRRNAGHTKVGPVRPSSHYGALTGDVKETMKSSIKFNGILYGQVEFSSLIREVLAFECAHKG